MCSRPSLQEPGPSPRVRGSRLQSDRVAPSGGSIPACAGEPSTCRQPYSSQQVHPRVCGGARKTRAAPVPASGPSPRVRGSPTPLSDLASMSWVHPRVCGGAGTTGMKQRGAMGPSPRVRGSLAIAEEQDLKTRSIPACAGEPASITMARAETGVHPRVCGGAPIHGPLQGLGQGPSPRVRGSPQPQPLARRERGSIPACAGEPRSAAVGGFLRRVHPRVCGGACRLTILRKIVSHSVV